MCVLGCAWSGLASAQAPAAAWPVRVPAAQISAGDTAWMISATTLVLLMTLPGLALFYGGMVRKKNVLGTLAQVLAVCALVTLLWWAIGYSLAFMPGTPWLGSLAGRGLDTVFFDKVGGHLSVHPLAPSVPESVFVMCQLSFAIITPALIVGAFAERMRFSAAYALGPRQGFGRVPLTPSNLGLTMAGAALLWVGWMGFNGGSAGAADGRAGMALLATQLGAAAGTLAWMLCEWLLRGVPTLLGLCSGAVAGLVAITPASGFVGPLPAVVIGVVGGPGASGGPPA